MPAANDASSPGSCSKRNAITARGSYHSSLRKVKSRATVVKLSDDCLAVGTILIPPCRSQLTRKQLSLSSIQSNMKMRSSTIGLSGNLVDSFNVPDTPLKICLPRSCIAGQLKHDLATLDRRECIWHVVSVFDASALRVWEHFRQSRRKVWQLDEHLQRM